MSLTSACAMAAFGLGAVTATSLVMPTAAAAQTAAGTPPAAGTPAAAVAEARQRLVCGTGTLIEATYLPGGQLRATCQSRTTDTLPQQLQGTELTATAIGAGAAAILFVVIAASGGDNAGTTTTAATGGD